MNRGAKQDGFTLIELMAVLLLMGLVAAVAAATLANPMRVATRQQIVAMIVAFDHDTRTLALRTGQPNRVIVDLDSRTLNRVEIRDTSELAAGQRFRLNTSWRLHAVYVDQRRFSHGEVAMNCSPQGTMPDYALEMTGPNSESMWLVFVGLTGQMIEQDNEQSVRDMLEATRRGDAG